MEGMEMAYTLAMAADQGIQIADDGVAEVSMTDARALLTRLIRTVREDGKTGSFTERGERRAYVVTPDFVFRAKLHGEVTERLRALANDKQLMERIEALDPDLHLLLDTGTI